MIRNIQKGSVKMVFAITVAIIILSTVFRIPVQIIDALTLNATPDFKVQISAIRVLFEPFFGPLLYFNRSLYLLDEGMILLWWILILFAVYTIIKLIPKKNGSNRKRFLLSQLANLPLVVGLWFSFIVITFFLSPYLPNNTIKNESDGKILVTTHSHSEFSHDGLISREAMWKWQKYNQFDAFFITDHNRHKKTLEFVNRQRSGEFPADPLVMCGEEFSGSNHLSLLGLKRNFNTHHYPDSVAIDSARANGAAVIVNHWYDGEHMTLEYYRDLGVDGFEIENTATEKTYDREVYNRVKKFCEENGLIMNGGLDFHGYFNVCALWNAFKIPGWHNLSQTGKEQAIIDVIRLRDQSKLQVLLYSDRAYYPYRNLFLRPVITLFNYFRTLNFVQILSWVVWMFLFVFVRSAINNSDKLKQKITANSIILYTSIAGAAVILFAGLKYYLRIAEVAGSDNDIYVEYSNLLFYIGAGYLLYSVAVLFYRVIKKR